MKRQGIPAIVAGLYLNGASVLRRLAALGFDAWGISHRPGDYGWATRHGRKALCPDPDRERDAWVAFLRDLRGRFDSAPLLIPCGDEFVVALDAAAAELRELYRFHGFGDGLRTRLTSKRETFALAERHGFPGPRSAFVSGRDELAAFAGEVIRELGADVLIKPEFPLAWRVGAGGEVAAGRKVMVGGSVDEILELYDTVAPHTPGVLAQEVVPGPDDRLIYWAGLVRADGVVAGRVVGRKVRLNPIHFGSASYVRLVDRPEVEAECERFLGALGYVGLCGVELKEDRRGGVAKLIEINPRWGLWDDIGIPVGVDLAGEAAAALLGETPPPRRPRHFRQKWVAVSLDVPAFLAYRAEGTWSTWEWLRSLTPPILFADLPLLTDFPYAWRQLRLLGRSVIGRWRGAAR